MNEMHDRYASSGLRVVALNVDKHSSDADAFLRQHPARFLVCFDSTGETPQRYAVKAMPTSLLIDPTGRVVWVHTGFRNEHREELEQKIKTALKGAA
jgi:peroxiredoxin